MLSELAEAPEDVREKHPASTASLITSLRSLRRTNPKAVHSTLHLYPPSIYAPESSSDAQARERRITSWKMTEHMYYNANNPFPTLARGLFTEQVEEGDTVTVEGEQVEGLFEEGDKRIRIVARGYDKFFNVDEVDWTHWDSMKQHTEPPYRLTLKSNGCLILISALTPHHLMVASKHSLGTTTEPEPEPRPEPASDPGPDVLEAPMADLLLSDNKVTEQGAAAATDATSTLATPQADSGQDAIPRDAESLVQGTEAPQDTTSDMHEDLELFEVEEKKQSKKSQKKERKAANKQVKKGQNVSAGTGNAKSARGRHVNDDDGEREAQAHAEVGRAWVRRTLAKNGKTEAELARRLWDGNLSAVLELCDDSFEEHVIATPEYWTGLHLHGLNHNTPHFATAPPSEVTALAEEFGFIPTKYVEFQTLEEVRSFTQDIAQSGSWQGNQIEGFVVRSIVKDTGGGVTEGKPPYRPGSPFFFKVKFDEPYLLYRQWREVTRVMLPLLKPKLQPQEVDDVWKRVRTKIKRPEIAVYADWAASEMESNPRLFDDYDRGIVRVRERFLVWVEGDEGKVAWREAKHKKYKLKGGGVTRVDKSGLPKKYIIVPISIPGTGKTLIGLALSKLYGFGHTQSDDITTKRSAPGFLKNITDLLAKQDVVFADRNNHVDKHYTELSNLGNERALLRYDIQLIAIQWDLTAQPYNKILRICSERVIQRGNNHATLRPDTTGSAEHEAVISTFMRNLEGPDPELFKALIRVEVVDEPLECLKKVVDGLKDVLGLEVPDDARLREVLEEMKGHRVTTAFHPPALKSGQAFRYFGISVEIDLAGTVERALKSEGTNGSAETARMLFEKLVEKNRIVAKPHVTLCHEEEVKAEKERSASVQPKGSEESANGDQDENDISKTVDVANGGGVQKHVLAGQDKGDVKDTTEVFNGGGKTTETAAEPGVAIPTSEKDEMPLPLPSPIGPEERLWQACRSISGTKQSMFDFRATHLVWDDRVMALVLCDLHPRDPAGMNLQLPERFYRQLHVTVGTISEDVRPRESSGLVTVIRDKIQQGEDEGELDEVVKNGGRVRWIKLDEVKGEGRVKGMW